MLGKGGLGTVHKAYDRFLRRRIAMKILFPEVLPEQAGLMSVLSDVRAAASLNHTNIVTIYDVGLRGGQPFIAMELVEGESAAAALLRRGAFDVAELMQYLVQICQGLSYAHDRGIVHQDVKPSNILVTVDKRVKLVDFGLAQPFSISSLAKRRYRTSTSLSGTSSYIAPERARGEPMDPRSDIYSLGASLYELLSGHPPMTLGDVIKYHFKKAIPALKTRRLDIPDALDQLVKRCLLVDRSARFQSVRELVTFATESELLPATAPASAKATAG